MDDFQRWFGGGGFMRMGGVRYEEEFACHTAAYLHNATANKINEVNFGGKILLPTSALDKLLRYNIQTPMMFTVTNVEKQRVTHAGVLEFSAPEGNAIFPKWMMDQLQLREGERVQIQSISLPKATFAKLKPMSTDFLNISNPRAVLEVELRKYACLTKGDKIPTTYAGQTLEFLIVDLKPSNAVCIIECDVNLDFDAPEGYVEQPRAASTANIKPAGPSAAALAEMAASSAAVPLATSSGTATVFSGSARRLDEKKKGSSVSMSSDAGAADSGCVSPSDLPQIPPVVCNEEYQPGMISFVRYDYKRRDVLEKELKEKELKQKGEPSQLFVGTSRTLRNKAA